MRIVQHFDHEAIRRMAYDNKLYVLKEENVPCMLSKHKVCKLTPEEINKLLTDDTAFFVTFEKSPLDSEPSTTSSVAQSNNK